MDGNEIAKSLDDVIGGRAPEGTLAALAVSMTPDDLVSAFDQIGRQAETLETPKAVESWTRLLADLLVQYAIAHPGPAAGSLASMAADVYRTDLSDPERTEIARVVSAVRRLDPIALGTLYERHAASLDEDVKYRLLRILVTLGDPASTQKYRPILDRILADRQAREEAEAIRMDRLATARRWIAEDRPPNVIVDLLAEHLADRPADRDGLAILAQTLVRAGRAEELDAFYGRGIDAASDLALRAEMLCDLGRIHLVMLKNPGRAAACFESALGASRGLTRAMEGLVAALEATGRLSDAVPILEHVRVETSGQPAESRVLPILASVYGKLGRVEDAERVWRRLRSIDPRNLGALHFYEEYYETRLDHQKLFTTLQFMLSVVDDPDEKVRINKKMATLAEGPLNNPERAIEAWRRVLALKPRDTEAESVLVSLYRRTRKWHALIEFHNDQFRRLADSDVEGRKAELYRIIEIYRDPDKLPNEDNALATYARILEVSPDDREALRTLAEGFESRERWPDLLKVLQKAVAVTTEPSEQLALYRKMAHVASTRMANETLAVPFLERILELAPEDVEVVQRLKGIYQRKHAVDKLYAMQLRELKMLSGPEREAALSAAAAMARDRLLRFDDALKLYEELYLLNPRSREARENLHQLYSRLEHWSGYARFLQDEVQRPMPKRRRIELRHKLGEILMDRLGDPEAARRVFEDILADDPTDAAASRRLETVCLELDDYEQVYRMYAGRNDVRSYVALLAQREAREQSPSRKVRLNLAMAEACEKDLQEPTRAQRHLERAYNLDPSLTDVGLRLLSAYETQDAKDRMIALLTDLAPSLEGPAERADAYLKLHDALAAQGRWAEAFAAGSEATRVSLTLGNADVVLARVRETVVQGGLWQEYAGLLQDVCDSAMEPGRRVAFLMELGHILRDRLAFHEEARQVLDRVLDLDPGNVEALAMQEDIALQREDYTGLERVLQRSIEVAKDAAEVRALRLRLGRLYEDLLGDDVSAAECYLQAVHADRDDREALAGLHRTYERSEKYAELAEVIRMEMSASPRDEARLKCELARVLWEHLGEIGDALAILGEVLESDGCSFEAHRQIRALFDGRLARDAAANLLAPFYRRAGRYEDLMALLQERLADLPRPEMRAVLRMEIADILYRIRGDTDAAFENVLAAVDLHAADPFVERLVALADATGRYEEAAAAIGSWVGIVRDGVEPHITLIPDPAREARLCLILGRLYADKLDAPDLAIRAFEKALPFEAEDEGLLHSLVDLYKAVGDLGAAVGVFDRLADSNSGGRRREVLLAKAAFAREIGRNDDAVATLRDLLVAGERDPEVESELEDLLGTLERWDELLDLLSRRLDLVSEPAERAETLYEMAVIERDQMRRNDRAATLLVRALGEDPTREEIRLSALAMLVDVEAAERLAYGPVVAGALEEVFRRDPKAKESLATVLKARAGFATEPWERVRFLIEVADIAEARGDRDAAFRELAAAFETVPGDVALLDRLLTTAGSIHREAELVEILERAAENTDTESRTRIRMTVASLCRSALKDPDRALAIYQQIRSASPGNPQVLRALDDVLHDSGRDVERIAVLQELADAVDTVEERRAVQLQVGELCAAIGDLQGSMAAFTFVLQNRPEDETLDDPARVAAQRLMDQADATGRLREAADLHLLVARTGSNPVEARTHRLTAGMLFLEGLKDPAAASEVFDLLLAEDPRDREARERAKTAARQRYDRTKLASLLREELRYVEGAQRIAPLMELSGLLLDRTGETLAAVELLEQVLAIDPAHGTARGKLLPLMDREDVGLRVTGILETAAERTQDNELLAKALTVHAMLAEDPAQARAVRLRLGRTLAGLGRRGEALEVLSRAWLANPTEAEGFSALVDLLGGMDRMSELATLVPEAIAGISSVAERVTLRFKVALALVQAGNAKEAEAILQENFKEDSRHLPSLELALTVHATLGQHDQILACLDRMIAASPDPEEKARVLMRAAAVAVSDLEDLDRAEQYYRDILALFPFHEEAGAALADLLQTRGDWAGLRALLADQVALLEGRGEPGDLGRVAQLRRTIAEMALGDGDFDAAAIAGLDILKAARPDPVDFDLARRIYEQAGRDPDLFDAIVEAFERTVDREGELAFLKSVVAMDLEKPTRRQVLERIVAVEEALGMDEALFEDLASIVLLAPEEAAPRKRLEGVARRAGRLEDLVDRLGRAFATHQDKQAAFDLAVTVSRILREDLHRDEEAADYLRVAHNLRPEDAGVVATLSDLYIKLGNFGDLALLYEGLGDSETDPGVRVGLYFKAFDVLRHRMRDAQGAAEILKRILDLEPSNRAALDELESIATETSDGPTLILALGRKAEVASTSTERRAILLQLARVQDEASDPAAAAATLREVVDTDGKCTEAYERLVELLGRMGRHEDLANLYERAVDWLASPAEKVITLKRAAALREGNLQDPRGASTLLLRILDVDPTDMFAFVRLSEILEREEDHNGLADLLRRRLKVASATSEIAALNARIGEILARHLGDEAGAVQHFKAALAIDPYLAAGRQGLEQLLESPLVAMEAALALEDVYEASGEALKLCDVLRAELAFVQTASDRETILLRIAEVCADRLSDASGALSALGDALAVNPANAETLERMEAAATRTAQWQTYYAILDQVAPEVTMPDVAARIHHKAAEVADRRLHLLREAADHYDAYLRRVPGDLDALEAVDRICTELGRSEDLARVLRLRLAAAGERADPDLRIRLASLLAKDLNDADGAVDQLRLALAARPGDREVIRQLSTLVSHPLAGRAAADILVVALRETGDDAGLLWALDRQIELAAEGSDTMAMHDEAAEVARRLGQRDEELSHLGQALVQRPSHEGLLRRLVEVGRQNDALRALAVGHLEDAAVRANWTGLERNLRIEAGRLAFSTPGLAAKAEAQMKRVLEIDPSCREAVEMLEAYYSGSGRSEDLNWLLERKLDLDLTIPERIATLRGLADLHLLRREIQKAAAVLEECLVLEPGDMETLRRLKGVLEELEDFKGQISVLERLAAATPDAAEKRQCLFDRARILQDRLGDLTGAKETLEALLTLDPGHSDARERLMALYEYLEEYKPLVDMLEARIRADGPVPGRIEAAMRAASIAEDHLEDLPAALALLRKAAELAPEDIRIVDEQIRLSYRAEDWAGLVEALRRRTAFASTPAERIGLLVQAAEVARVNLLDLELAGTIARQVLALDPVHPSALLTVACQMEAKGEAEEALVLFRRLSEATGDMDQRVEALLGVSRTLLATGQKGPEVRNALLSAARIKPNHPQVTKQLRQMYLEAEDYEALVDVMRRQLSMATTDEERATLNMDIAEVYLTKLRDGQQFIQYAEEAHRFRRDDPRVVLAIVNYYLMLHDSKRAVPYLEWLVKYLESRRRLRELPPYAHELGRIMEASGDIDRAIEYYRLCHEHDAANLDNTLALGRLYRSRGETEKALRIYQPLLLRIDSFKPANQVEILLALAGLVFDAGDRRKARQYLQRVLAIEPENVDAQALLAKCD